MAKIINQTKYRTDHLRAFLSRIVPVEIDDVEKRKRLIVTFKTDRSGHGVHGNAYVGGIRSTIYLPKVGDPLNKAGIAKVISHELAHNRGLSGERSMRRSGRYGWRDVNGDPTYKTIYAWAEELPLEVAEKRKPAKSSAEKNEAEMVKIEAAIARWQTKAKRAETAIKKYQRKLKYRQSKSAALAATQTEASR